jgi:hypothetical protein
MYTHTQTDRSGRSEAAGKYPASTCYMRVRARPKNQQQFHPTGNVKGKQNHAPSLEALKAEGVRETEWDAPLASQYCVCHSLLLMVLSKRICTARNIIPGGFFDDPFFFDVLICLRSHISLH